MTNPLTPGAAPQPPAQKSGSGKWFLFGGIGCVVLLLGACLVTAAIAFFMRSSALPNSYINSPGHLSAKLQSNFTPFSFRYPNDWKVVEDGSKPDDSNFIKIEKSVPDGSDTFTSENFAVGWFSGSGSLLSDRGLYSQLATTLANQLSGGFPNFRIVSQGETTVNGYQSYEMLFTSEVTSQSPPIKLFGRMILVSGGNVGEKNGVVLLLLATDKQHTVTQPADLGVLGDCGKILPTFKLGK